MLTVSDFSKFSWDILAACYFKSWPLKYAIFSGTTESFLDAKEMLALKYRKLYFIYYEIFFDFTRNVRQTWMCSFEKQLLYFDLNNCYHFIAHSRKPQREKFMLKWQNEMWCSLYIDYCFNKEFAQSMLSLYTFNKIFTMPQHHFPTEMDI